LTQIAPRTATVFALIVDLKMSDSTHTFFFSSVDPVRILITVFAGLSVSAFKTARNVARITEIGGCVQEKSTVTDTGSFFESSIESGVTLIALVGAITSRAELNCSVTVLAL